MRQDTLPVTHFEQLYARRPDPWRLDASDYERAKYAATLAALERPRYGRGLEIGCAKGVFTALLADRCDRLLAIEPVEVALAQARRRNRGRPWVTFASLFVPGHWPAATFDLIVISEVLDYLGEADIARLAERVGDALDPGGDLVLVHWVGKRRGRPRAEEASDRLIATAGPRLTALRADRNPDYRLDVLRRNSPSPASAGESVAAKP